MDSLVSNVSDTARWVSAHRAKESARPDALFRDPLAERLAGQQGHAIAARLPQPNPRNPGNNMWSAAACVTQPLRSGQ